jgi:hypothetical protein
MIDDPTIGYQFLLGGPGDTGEHAPMLPAPMRYLPVHRTVGSHLRIVTKQGNSLHALRPVPMTGYAYPDGRYGCGEPGKVPP